MWPVQITTWAIYALCITRMYYALRSIIHQLSNKVHEFSSPMLYNSTAVYVDERLKYRSSVSWGSPRGLMWQGNESMICLLSRDRRQSCEEAMQLKTHWKLDMFNAVACWTDSHINTLSTLVHAKTSSSNAEMARVVSASLRRSRSFKVLISIPMESPHAAFQ